MHGTIVTGEITDEALDDLQCKSAPLEKTVNIKQVTRMLAIHRGDKFAAVKFRRGQNRHGQLGGKKFPRCVTKSSGFHWQNGSAKNVIHFNLYLVASTLDEQLNFVTFFRRRNFRFHAKFGESLPHGV